MDKEEFNLKVDEQVAGFIEVSQKLTYFLVTGSVAVIAFMADLIFDKESLLAVTKLPGCSKCVFGLVGIAGLLSAGAALKALHFEIKSYRLHLKWRYQGKGYGDLSETVEPEKTDKRRWKEYNGRASFWRESSFFCFWLEMAFAVAFFILVLKGAGS